MKQNWWKLLVVVVLAVAVGVVLAGKNHESGDKAAVVAESTVDTPADNTIDEQTAKGAETKAREPDKAVTPTTRADQAKSDASAVTKPAAKAERPKATPKRLPKMIDLGADKCIPCKMMKPIIAELQKDHKGKLDVVFIDVWKNPAAAEKYDIKSIPTQVFLDENGKEFFRHPGFFPKGDILKKFQEQGIKL